MTYLTLRSERVRNFRRLEVDAAKHELREAQASVARTRGATRVARAEVARLEAERNAGRVAPSEVAAARHQLQVAQREQKAAAAAVRTHRAQLSAARAMLPHASSDPAKLPLARLMAEHDAVTAQWMQYETDPAKLIAFPAMSDVRVPATAHFLIARDEARQLRPETAKTRIGLSQYTAYRDAVRRLERSFTVAEREAWRLAGAGVPGQQDAYAAGPPAWADVAQNVLSRSAQALSRASEVASAAFERARETRSTPSPSPAPSPTPPSEPTRHSPSSGGSAPSHPVWPVPSRSRTSPPAS